MEHGKKSIEKVSTEKESRLFAISVEKNLSVCQVVSKSAIFALGHALMLGSLLKSAREEIVLFGKATILVTGEKIGTVSARRLLSEISILAKSVVKKRILQSTT